MKILKWVIIILAWLFLIATFAFDKYISLPDFDWLILRLLALGLNAIFLILFRNRRSDESKLSAIALIGFYILWFAFYGYKEIARYQLIVAQDKLGLPFNKKRRILGVPEIPPGWRITFRGSRSIDWGAKDTVGHYSKYISVDSLGRLEFEMDNYRLRAVDSVCRSISINTYYSYTKGVADSIFYDYNFGDGNKRISRKQADSLFAVEKFSKDY